MTLLFGAILTPLRKCYNTRCGVKTTPIFSVKLALVLGVNLTPVYSVKLTPLLSAKVTPVLSVDLTPIVWR